MRRDLYPELGPSRSHDLNLPFGLAKRGFRSLYAPAAVAEEKLVPTIEGEFERKRRMMRGLWDIVVTDRMWDLRGYSPTYAFEIISHRLARYGSPILHAVALAANLLLLRRARIYTLTLLAQLAVIAATAGPEPGHRPARSAGRCACSATTGSSPPRSRSAPSTGSATGRPPPGRSRRGRDDDPGRAARADRGGDRPRLRRARERAAGRLREAEDRVCRAGSIRSSPGSCWLLLSPALLVIAILIRLDSRGPVLFKQIRVGRYERPFQLYKLRTMSEGSDPVGVGTVLEREDPRITRTGAWLRRFSIDEVPNLLNVVRGEMRIVGPRPTIPSQVVLFSDRQRRRHDVRPGMTGWAQINGRVGLEWGERIELDIYYVENRSLALDLRIIFRTVWQVLSGKGLYTGG